jgi:hypothetical protein
MTAIDITRRLDLQAAATRSAPGGASHLGFDQAFRVLAQADIASKCLATASDRPTR